MSAEPISTEGLDDTPVLDTIVRMHEGTHERSGLDEETYMLVRLAALVATDAAPVSYLVNLGAAGELGVEVDKVTGTLVAVAPVVGSARIASAASKMIRAGLLGTALAESVAGGPDR
jgi:alkylhydroperoxidase/carboxymuconolactone decarboxylase family protein YurZ